MLFGSTKDRYGEGDVEGVVDAIWFNQRRLCTYLYYHHYFFCYNFTNFNTLPSLPPSTNPRHSVAVLTSLL